MKVLAVDLDRTIIPNGLEVYDNSLPLLSAIIDDMEILLIYVTARKIESIKKVIVEYNLPIPKYVISKVGAVIYYVKNGNYLELEKWQDKLSDNSSLWDFGGLKSGLVDIENLTIQKDEEQHKYKLSYYIDSLNGYDKTVSDVNYICYSISGSSAEVTASKDLNSHKGYIDIMPRFLSKLSALLFLQDIIGFKDEEILFAGDSGNDLPVLRSHFSSILVKNSEIELKKLCGDFKCWIAEGISGLNGNYSSGIIEGIIKKGWISVEKISKSVQNLKLQ